MSKTTETAFAPLPENHLLIQVLGRKRVRERFYPVSLTWTPACVELRLEDGALLSIDCTAVENEVAKQYVPAVGAGLANLQQSAGLYRTGFEW